MLQIEQSFLLTILSFVFVLVNKLLFHFLITSPIKLVHFANHSDHLISKFSLFFLFLHCVCVHNHEFLLLSPTFNESCVKNLKTLETKSINLLFCINNAKCKSSMIIFNLNRILLNVLKQTHHGVL